MPSMLIVAREEDCVDSGSTRRAAAADDVSLPIYGLISGTLPCVLTFRQADSLRELIR